MEGNESTGAVEASKSSEEVSEGLEALEGAGSEEEIKEIVKELYKVNINGSEKEVDLETLKRDYQSGRAAQERFREASDIKKKADTTLNSLKDDPWAAMQELGLDPYQMSVKYLEDKFRLDDMSEEERYAEAQKTDFQREKEIFEKEKAEYDAQKAAEAQNKESDFYIDEIEKAIDKYNLPKSSVTVTKMADTMLMNIRSGFELPMETIAEIVHEEYMSDVKSILGASSGDQLLGILGNDLSDRIRKSDLAKLKKPESSQEVKIVDPDVSEEAGPATKMRKGESPSEFFARMRSR